MGGQRADDAFARGFFAGDRAVDQIGKMLDDPGKLAAGIGVKGETRPFGGGLLCAFAPFGQPFGGGAVKEQGAAQQAVDGGLDLRAQAFDDGAPDALAGARHDDDTFCTNMIHYKILLLYFYIL